VKVSYYYLDKKKNIWKERGRKETGRGRNASLLERKKIFGEGKWEREVEEFFS